MAKDSSKRSFLDFFKMKDLDDDDEFEDDLFDEVDDEDDFEPAKPKNSYVKNRPAGKSQNYSRTSNYSASQVQSSSRAVQSQQGSYTQTRAQARPQNNNLVDFNSNKQQRSNNYRGGSEVYVIKPQEISESQTVADFLNAGKTIVINMEGLELAPAQRIIDFIGGACYAIGGSLQAISANIFIAAPKSIEVSGDLREEILNETTVSPQLGQY